MNQKHFIFLLAVVSACLFAAPVTTADRSEMGVATMNVDAGLIVGQATSSAGVDLGISGRVTDAAPLYLGGNIGAFVATGSPSHAVLPVMAGLHYEFGAFNRVHPLLGALAGPVISTGPYDTNVDFALIFRPGVNIDVGRTAWLNVEPRFGVMGSDFVIMPVIGASFLL